MREEDQEERSTWYSNNQVREGSKEEEEAFQSMCSYKRVALILQEEGEATSKGYRNNSSKQGWLEGTESLLKGYLRTSRTRDWLEGIELL
jgi:hypothetical protein